MSRSSWAVTILRGCVLSHIVHLLVDVTYCTRSALAGTMASWRASSVRSSTGGERAPFLNPFVCFLYQSLRPSSALKLLANDTFWLSHAPFTPGSLFPGAGTTRIATVAHFRLVAASPTSTSELILLNAHLDHVSDDQRRLGAAMLLHRARYEAHAKPGVPLFVTGDFNRCAAAPPAI